MLESRDSLLADCQQLMANGKWNEARSRLENAFATSPSDVLIAYTLASACRISGAADRAAQLFQAIHTALPDMAEAATGLAFSLAELNRATEATNILRQYLVRHPEQASAYGALAEIWMKSGFFAAVTRGFKATAILAPTADNLGNLAESISLQRSFELAEQCYQRALAEAPGSAKLQMNYAIHLLTQGKTDEGWKYFEARLHPDVADAPIRTLSLPRWDGNALADKHILVVSEQGLGDEIRLAAMLPELVRKARALTVECDPRLVTLFKRSMPSVDFHAFSRIKKSGRGYYTYGWLPGDGGPECYIEIGSLPLMLGHGLTMPENVGGFLVPSITLQDEIGDKLRASAKGRPLVGLSWASSARQFGRATNYPPPESWRRLLDLPEICLVSLQYGEAARAVKEMEEATGHMIIQLEELDLRDDLEALAALEASLDLVLAVGNATAALSGALGTKTLELLASPGWVPLLNDRDSFLGATHRVAQKQLGDWIYPVERVRELALAHLRKR
ncbi:tetratricopeptide repeat protein [Nisaea sp.]|uniref:tetratricopeptide repeat protein n=1 Tax=Nisaea sp. TaxID=2024842 RepID=UPI0032993D5D